ncbi:hypothetical protein AK812_SmicGene34219 [Symbiodinium microadriaticum]|uniref:Endonuclease/exonuclease/phosphatase domain-containing protein n=1 Tax=Symbiodinium microadriaticum TaxID=2951 RepID=A0A1Q9CPJ9_SYMMI|nr:hypothetical protein AK812_SmicGene34219 [Symbiodinium microadriaticum]
MYRWTGTGWVAEEGAPVAEQASRPCDQVRLRLATFNILADCFPWFVRLAIDSEKRFAALVDELSRLDADVLVMNEVTGNSLRRLLDSEYVRTSYYVSELPTGANGTLTGSHGCVMFSKLPMTHSYALRMDSMKREAIFGVLEIASRKIAVCSLHTVAHQSPQNKAVRAKQLSRVVAFAREQRLDGFFVAGDLNLHYTAEDAVVPANGLLDAWAETHFGESGDADPGYTFDAGLNSMIPRYIPGEVRKMRLDRILVSEKCALVPEKPCELWATSAVDASRDIFLSDHFGLVQDLIVDPKGWHGEASVRRQLQENGAVPLEVHPVSNARFGLALVSHVGWLALRQRGQIVEVDEDGDAYIRFRDHRKKQWVYSENLPYLAKVLFDKGDILHVRRSFHCGSFHIRRGQTGVAKRLDAGGDLLVEFDQNVGDQWVQYYSLVFMEKEKPADSSGPSKQKATAEARVWLYNPPAFRDVAVRATPDIDGPRTQVTLRPGQRFMVSEEHVGTDGVRYLKLADGSGWMFENKPGAGVLCVRQNGGMPGDLLSRLSDKTPPDDKLLHEEDAKAFLMHMHRILNSKQVRPAVEGLQRELPDRIRSVTEVQRSQETQLTIEKAKRILIDACKSLFKDFGFQVSQEGQQELLDALREHESCNLVYIMATSIELVLQIPPGGWFGLSQLRRGFQVVVKEGPAQLVGKRGVLLKRDGEQWQVRLDGVDEAQLLPSEDLVIAPDPNAVKEASKAKEIKASASEKELEMEAWQMASLAAVRGKSHGKQLTEAPWWAVCQDRASRRATGRLAERELLAIASGSEASWSESLKRPNKSLPPAPLPIEDERVPSVFAMIEEIEADENRDRVRNEFKALARRRKPQPQAVATVPETVGGSSASSGRRRGAFSTRAGALEEKPEATETFLDAEEEQDSDDLRTAEARANRGDIRDLLRREKFACSRKDAELAVMTGKLDRNPGRIAVEGRNEELPPRRTRPQCVKEEFERQRARWHLPPRGKHVGYMPQAHVLGTGQGNLGALEDGASSAPRRRADKDLLAPSFGGLPEFDDQPGFFRGSGFASFG